MRMPKSRARKKQNCSFLLLNSLFLRQAAAMRILIATVIAGGGHLAAAALEEAWRALRPDDTVERDFL